MGVERLWFPKKRVEVLESCGTALTSSGKKRRRAVDLPHPVGGSVEGFGNTTPIPAGGGVEGLWNHHPLPVGGGEEELW